MQNPMTPAEIEETLNRLVAVDRKVKHFPPKANINIKRPSPGEPEPKSEFEDLAALLDFYHSRQEYEEWYVNKYPRDEMALESLHKAYQEAASRLSLSGVLPTGSRLFYTYNGGDEWLRGSKFLIENQDGNIIVTGPL